MMEPAFGLDAMSSAMTEMASRYKTKDNDFRDVAHGSILPLNSVYCI